MADECKICKETINEPDNPLVSPCNCTGSIGKVHHNCLEQWIQTSDSNQCNICNCPYFQRTIHSGPLPESMVLSAIDTEKRISKLVSLFIFIFATSTLSGTVLRKLCNYFLWSRLTFTKIALYNVYEFIVYAAIGTLIGIGRQITIRINNTRIQFDGTGLIKPVSTIFAVIELLIAHHHITYTGWTTPTALMYGIGMYNLGCVVVFDHFLQWYQKRYFKRVFIEDEEAPQ